VSPQPKSASKRRSSKAVAPASAAADKRPVPAGSDPTSVGQRLRTERERQNIGLRELSRRLGVSASLISQIELGKATPSVGTLYSMVQELNMSMDVLFFEATDGSLESGGARGRERAALVDATTAPEAVPPGFPPSELLASLAEGAQYPQSDTPLVRTGDRQMIHLGSGVTWERMSPDTDHSVDFLYVTYDVGGASAPEQSLIRHGGREYGHLLEGRLGVTVGFQSYELEPGDAISFDSTMPHRLFNAGDTPAKAIWFVVGRQDSRVPRNGDTTPPAA
jgi:transcriptional regulator with XRE-family HTH domain/mannose-6-phosphate isomerase-like protein (cupin superfamily)